MLVTSPGFIDLIFSLFHDVSQTIPISAIPTPAWANMVPQAERGSPRARPRARPSGSRNKPQRSAPPPWGRAGGHREKADALGDIDHGAHDHKQRKADRERREGAAANRPGPYHRHHKQCRDAGRDQTLGGAKQVAAFPG